MDDKQFDTLGRHGCWRAVFLESVMLKRHPDLMEDGSRQVIFFAAREVGEGKTGRTIKEYIAFSREWEYWSTPIMSECLYSAVYENHRDQLLAAIDEVTTVKRFMEEIDG